jgi:hypothetical protein
MMIDLMSDPFLPSQRPYTGKNSFRGIATEPPTRELGQQYHTFSQMATD